jgi:hypothetical protein
VSGADNQQERLSSREQRRWWLAGFVEGEGSVCVSIKRHPTATFGYFVQPEFFLYQQPETTDALGNGCGGVRVGHDLSQAWE